MTTLPTIPAHPFTSGELLLHHRAAAGHPITCGVSHGCITAVVEDVQCQRCLEALTNGSDEETEAMNR